MFGVQNLFVGFWIDIQEFFDFPSFEEMFFNDGFRVGRLHLHVKGIVGNDFDDGAFLTKTETAGTDDLDFFFQPVVCYSGSQILNDLFALGCTAACATAHQNIMRVLCHSLYMNWGIVLFWFYRIIGNGNDIVEQNALLDV